jgi:putative hydroxymethylpyrimidine transport system substrate-binding protein
MSSLRSAGKTGRSALLRAVAGAGALARVAAAAGLVTAVAAALAGCASSPSASGQATRDASLVLDFTPNAIHSGIYAAIARGYLTAVHVHLRVIVPSASTDAISLLEAGRVNFAILDIHDLAIARARGAHIEGVMAIEQRPLAAVIAQASIRTPRQLQGRTVGVTGDPSDLAVLRSVVSGAGGDPRLVHTITIGYDAVPALLAGRVAAATAFWNDEGVELAHERPGAFHSFLVQSFGAPSYPELVLCASSTEIHTDPALVRAVVGALVRGYRFTIAHPAAAEADLESAVSGLNPREVSWQLHAELSAFRGPDGQVGELDMPVLRRWAVWEARFGIVSRPPDVLRMFDAAFVVHQSRAG